MRPEEQQQNDEAVVIEDLPETKATVSSEVADQVKGGADTLLACMKANADTQNNLAANLKA
jgi:hypothetical protein